MTREMFQAALDKIPQLVAEIAEYNGEDVWIEILNEYTPSGTLFRSDKYVITDVDVRKHVRAATTKGYKVEAFDDHITITRVLSDGSKFVVDYYPYIGLEA